MTQTVLILGANGRFGRAATLAFAAEGWCVIAATRTGEGSLTEGVSRVACDVTDRAALVAASQGVDVIVHAVNPPYQDWAKLMPVHTANIIAAGLSSGATVMISGNVYTFGVNAKVSLNERDAPAPTTRKGVMRVTMERAFAGAQAQGLRTIILRGGDFIEQAKSGNWFDIQITEKAHKGMFIYPGDVNVVHAWAYLPDMARAMVGLAQKRDTLAPFSTFGFEGYSITGEELKSAVAVALGHPLRQKPVPWWAIHLAGLFSPVMFELREMRYLWDTAHRIDGGALQTILPDFRPTPLAKAMSEVFAKSGYRT